MTTFLKDYVKLWVEASHGKSPPCLVWCQWVLCKWIYNTFNFSRALIRQPQGGIMQVSGGSSSSRYVTTMTSLVTVGNVIVEI